MKVETVDLHNKNPELGKKPQFRTNSVICEKADVEGIKKGERFLLFGWGVFEVTSINGDKLSIRPQLEDKEYKKYRKINWLPSGKQYLLRIKVIEYDHLLTIDKPDKS